MEDFQAHFMGSSKKSLHNEKVYVWFTFPNNQKGNWTFLMHFTLNAYFNAYINTVRKLNNNLENINLNHY